MPPTMERRRSSRLLELANGPPKPTLIKKHSSTASISGALGALKMEKKPSLVKKQSSSGEIVSAAASFARFKKMDAEAVKPKKTPKQMVAKAKFDSKISKFEAKAEAAKAPAASARGAKNKIAAFEQHNEEELIKAAPSFRTTWKVGAGTNYKKTKEFADGVAPKKSLKDLP